MTASDRRGGRRLLPLPPPLPLRPTSPTSEVSLLPLPCRAPRDPVPCADRAPRCHSADARTHFSCSTAQPSDAMAASTTWLEWLAQLVSGLRAPPAPGTHEAKLEQLRVGALYRKELCKPPGQRDEELTFKLCAEFYKLQLANVKASACATRRCRRRSRRDAAAAACTTAPAAALAAAAGSLCRQEQQQGFCTRRRAAPPCMQAHACSCAYLPCRSRRPCMPGMPPSLSSPPPGSAALLLGGCGSV